MTHLCYTLEEAAEKLKLSETVLVRLSQYFKVPRAAYEDVGYLSFKGDLAFTEEDLAFFRQAKERLLSGNSLDEVKSRMRENVSAGGSMSSNAEAHSLYSSQSPTWNQPLQGAGHGPGIKQPSGAAPQNRGKSWVPGEQQGVQPDVQKVSPNVPNEDGPQPIREIQDRKPYEKAAEQSFERYKSIHRTGLGKVFENMLKEVGSSASRRRSGSEAPGYKPMRNKAIETPEQLAPKRHAQTGRKDALLPFVRGLGSAVQPGRPAKSQAGEPSWDQVIHDAVSNPRTMNTQLKSAAALLRDKTLGNEPQQGHRPF